MPRPNRRTFLKGSVSTGLVALGLAGCSGQDDPNGGGTDTPEPTETESQGTVTGTPGGQDLSGPIVQYGSDFWPGLEEEFAATSGVQTDSVHLTGSDMVTRFVNEVEGGTESADVLVLNSSVLWSLADHFDRLVAIDNPNRDKVYSGDRAGGDRLASQVGEILGEEGDRIVQPIYAPVTGHLYNTNNVSEPPVTFEDFLDDQYTPTGTAPYTMDLILHLLEETDYSQEEAEQLLMDIEEAGIQYIFGGASAVQSIISGEVDTGMFINIYQMNSFRQDGAPVDATLPPKTGSAYSMMVVTDAGQATEAAREYAKFATSATGQEYVQQSQGGLLPMHEDLDHGNDHNAQLIDEYVEEWVPEAFLPGPEEGAEYESRVGEILNLP